jgi:hypothetical protein
MLAWKRSGGGSVETDASPKGTPPGKMAHYRVSRHFFLGMKTNTYNVTRWIGFSAYPDTIATGIANLDVGKAVAQADHDRRQ